VIYSDYSDCKWYDGRPDARCFEDPQAELERSSFKEGRWQQAKQFA